MTTQNQLLEWRELAQQLRVDSVRATTAAGSGHPSSSLSAADLAAVLLSKYLRIDFTHPHSLANDHFILSKGHAAPLLYAMLKSVGVISDEELLSLRKFGSPVQGHPVPGLPGISFATGSLGQGLGMGVGCALAAEHLEKSPSRTWVLLGDSEMSEGSVWEALETASYYRCKSLTALIDMNRLGQRGQTALGWNTEAYAARGKAFGWHTIEIDGHDLAQIDRALGEAITTESGPVLIIARTEKGKGVSLLENQEGWHGKPLPADKAKEALTELGGPRRIRVQPPSPLPYEVSTTHHEKPARPSLPSYKEGSLVAPRRAFGDTLLALGEAHKNIVALDAEVSNSTYSELFAERIPERFFQMFIAEQQLFAAAIGLQACGYRPFVSTFAAFLSRAHDFARMGVLSHANIAVVGTHAGCAIGEDGPSQMGLEDLAMFCCLDGSTVLSPCDANQTARLLALMADAPGISYLRALRNNTPVIYSGEEIFTLGGSRLLGGSPHDIVTIVATGITVHEALKAQAKLKADGIPTRVMDAYSIKPFDSRTLLRSVSETRGNLIIVEDHRPEGGLGSAVLSCFTADEAANITPSPSLRIVHLAVRHTPGSGPTEDLLHAARIDADAIEEAARSLTPKR